jgi:hypothetical protein
MRKNSVDTVLRIRLRHRPGQLARLADGSSERPSREPYFSRDADIPNSTISNPDRLYHCVLTALDNLLEAVGLEAAQEQTMKFWLPAPGFLLLTRTKFM